MKKIITTLLLLTLAGLTGWQVYERLMSSGGPSGKKKGSLAVAVETEAVQQRLIQDIGQFTGTLFARSRVVVAPKINGHLKKLWVNIGDSVKPNQLLAQLDDDEYVQQSHQAQAAVEVAKANMETRLNAMELARRQLERSRALKNKKLLSATELENAESQFAQQQADYRVAQAQVTEKQSELEAANIRLSYTRISAVWDEIPLRERVVGERFVDEGALLSPNSPIVSILDISSLVAVIHVTEREYFKLNPGQNAVVFNDVMGQKTFHGKVVRIAPMIQETSREARVEIEIPNADHGLKPGMFVRVSIQFSEHPNATVIPLKAIVERDGQKGIFLANTQEMKVVFTPVTQGIVQGEWVEIVQPLLAGQVVTLGQHLLQDGSEIVFPVKNTESSSESPQP
ncbi:MAG: efflux RND transporter periplasmic adaptor subunit [SAR324 cluster bacterium]|nr:efflux RND transporter periplasmic adaptor subunit [SAR324 cluster bacterium]